MKIVRKQSPRAKASPLIWIAVIAMLLVLVLLFDQSRSGMDLPASWNEVARFLRLNSGAGELPTLTIDMAFAEYDQILRQREDALASGVVLVGDADFMPAEIRYADQVVPVLMRLKQGSAVHLGEGDKWNFDVRTDAGQHLAGLQRFYLVDPADNNWLNEWAFGAALRREDVMAGRYQFVRLFLNGDDWGVYALQEGFDPQLLAFNNRPEGVIVEYDASPLWRSIAYFGGDYQSVTADPVTNLTATDFQFFEVDTFRDATIANDPQLTAQKDQAIGMLRGLQSGDLAASEIFDVEKYGRFLALADLWGATESTSPLNLRYYFNPRSGLLEPIGFNANPLTSSERLSLASTYDDLNLQKAYAQAAARMSRPEYLADLEQTLQPQMETRQQLLPSAADLPSPWETLAQRQAEMRRSLNPLQPLFAYLGPPTLAQEGIIRIDVANVLNLPLEILGFDIDGATFLEVDPAWIQNNQNALIRGENGEIILRAAANDQSPTVGYVRFHLPLTQIIAQDSELDFMHELDIQVATRIVGQDEIQKTSARPGYPDPVAGPTASNADQ
jgi:hypothetical protein